MDNAMPPTAMTTRLAIAVTVSRTLTHTSYIWYCQINALYLVIPNMSTPSLCILTIAREGCKVKTRKLPLGNRNMIGARVTEARERLGMKQTELLSKLQVANIDISIPALSLLEGQKRPVSDFEINALADILSVSVDWLLGRGK